MNQTVWYYADAQNARQGPVAAVQIRQLLADGQLRPSSPLWREGMEQWQPLQDLSESLGVTAEVSASNPYAAPGSDVVGVPEAGVLPDKLQAYADFVGPNFEVYRRKWHLDEGGDATGTWNWPAFLCGAFWMLHRKMYGVAGLWLLGVLLVSLLEGLLGIPDGISLLLNFAFPVAAGAWGNQLYLRHTERLILQIRSSHAGGSHALRAELALRGGTNIAAALGGLGLFLVANIVLVALIS